MASLFLDPLSCRFYVRFRYGGRTFKRSLKTSDLKRARGTVARVDETLALLHSGRLEMPVDADPAVFILSDGKRTDQVVERPVHSLGDLFDAYRQQRIPGVKEANTVKTEELHMRHLQRILKRATFLQAIKSDDLQAYVSKRLSEKCGRRTIAAETVRKELATLRVIWNWGVRHEFIDRPAPVVGLQFPKRDERHPYRTWDEITAILARGSVSTIEERQLWESLYLTREEVHESLEYARRVARHPFILPLLSFVAHTGVRISEALRSRIEDIDFQTGKVLVREKKRSRVRSTTYRRIEMTPLLMQTLKDWFSQHPGGLYTFAKASDLNRGRTSTGIVPINKHVARKHFKLTFRGSRWAKLRGYHIYRHSFASNLAAQGVDQRIIDEWMGHQTDEMRRRYRHLLPQATKAAILKLMPGG